MRVVALAIAVVVGGLSSSFALCVSGCTQETAPSTAAHACHEQGADLKIAAGTGACAHAPAVTATADVSRDPKAASLHLAPSAPVVVALVDASHVSSWAVIEPRTPLVSSRPVLRI